MRRRRFLQLSALLTTGASPLPAGPTAAAGTFTPLRGDVGYYTNRGGTIGVYRPRGGTGGVVVDSQFPEQARQFLREVIGEGQRLDLLANTHHHGDHTGGNGVLAPLATSHLVHERTRSNLEQSESRREEGVPLPLPTATFDKRWTMILPNGKEIVTARYFGPAHTGGDAVIHLENANVAHVGDLVFNRRFPYVDPGAGGNMTNWIGVLRKIRKAYDRNTIFIFGHAADSYPVTGDATDLKAMENYLDNLRKYVKREKKAGTPLDALKAKTSTIPGAPEWSYGERLRGLNLEVMWEEV